MRSGAVELGVVAVGVGSAKTEDVSRLEDVPEGPLHLALANCTSESQSDEWPTAGTAAGGEMTVRGT